MKEDRFLKVEVLRKITLL